MANPNSPLSAIVARTGLFCAYRPALRVPASSARTGLTGWRMELDMDLDMDRDLDMDQSGRSGLSDRVSRGYQGQVARGYQKQVARGYQQMALKVKAHGYQPPSG